MKILLAFSDPLLPSMLRSRLCDHECDLVVAADANDFIENCRNNQFDCVVTSFFEPFLSGADLAHQIRATQNSRRTAIFLVCPFHYQDTQVSLYESGVDQYITLPLDINRLTRKILTAK